MKKILSLIIAAAMLFSMAVTFTGCDSKAKDKELTEIVISEFRGIAWASVYAADLLGYFEEEGLKPKYMIYKDGPIAFQGMHAGDSDFSLLSAEPIMTAYDKGMESYMLFTNTNNRSFGFAASKDITDISQLKGKTIFAGMPGSAPYSFVLSLLEAAGMSENDVSFMNTEYSAAITALGEKQLDAIYFDIYNKKKLLETVPDANILVDATDKQTHIDLYGSEFCQTTVATCTKAFADKNPEIVQKFVNANVKALKWISEHTSEELAELLIPMFEGMTKEELTYKYETLKSSFSSTGEIVPEGYKTVEDFCLSQGLISKEIGFENIIPTEFMNKALGK